MTPPENEERRLILPSPAAEKEYRCEHGNMIKHYVHCRSCCHNDALAKEKAALDRIGPLKYWIEGLYGSEDSVKTAESYKIEGGSKKNLLPDTIRQKELELEELKQRSLNAFIVYDEWYPEESDRDERRDETSGSAQAGKSA